MSDSLSRRLHDAAAALRGEQVALAHLADVHGPAAHGTLLVLLAAPCMLPVPGVGTVLGLGLLALAGALWRGHGNAVLPPAVAALHLPVHWARRVLTLLGRFYGLAGRLTRARMCHLAEPGQRSWLAAQAALMAVLIVLPIPFGNVLPALSLMLTGLALVFRDGLATLLAVALAGCSLLYCAALGLGLWTWGMAPLLKSLGG